MSDKTAKTKTPAASELPGEALDKVSGGPIYMKIDGIDGSFSAADGSVRGLNFIVGPPQSQKV